LWGVLRGYSGWGHDLDALAALRGGTETSVVVLEPVGR
jgi:hypothetical protein